MSAQHRINQKCFTIQLHKVRRMAHPHQNIFIFIQLQQIGFYCGQRNGRFVTLFFSEEEFIEYGKKISAVSKTGRVVLVLKTAFFIISGLLYQLQPGQLLACGQT